MRNAHCALMQILQSVLKMVARIGEHQSVDEQLQGLWEMRWIAGKSYDVELRWTIHSIIHQIAVALSQMMNWCTNMYTVYVTNHHDHDHVHYMHHHQLMRTAIFANKLHKGSNHHTKHAVANAGHIMIISPAFHLILQLICIAGHTASS